MKILELRKLLLATPLAFAAVIMLPACSTTEEEEAPPADSGSGLPCDVDPGQPECLEQLK